MITTLTEHIKQMKALKRLIDNLLNTNIMNGDDILKALELEKDVLLILMFEVINDITKNTNLLELEQEEIDTNNYINKHRLCYAAAMLNVDEAIDSLNYMPEASIKEQPITKKENVKEQIDATHLTIEKVANNKLVNVDDIQNTLRLNKNILLTILLNDLSDIIKKPNATLKEQALTDSINKINDEKINRAFNNVPFRVIDEEQQLLTELTKTRLDELEGYQKQKIKKD